MIAQFFGVIFIPNVFYYICLIKSYMCLGFNFGVKLWGDQSDRWMGYPFYVLYILPLYTSTVLFYLQSSSYIVPIVYSLYYKKFSFIYSPLHVLYCVLVPSIYSTVPFIYSRNLKFIFSYYHMEIFNAHYWNIQSVLCWSWGGSWWFLSFDFRNLKVRKWSASCTQTLRPLSTLMRPVLSPGDLAPYRLHSLVANSCLLTGLTTPYRLLSGVGQLSWSHTLSGQTRRIDDRLALQFFIL